MLICVIPCFSIEGKKKGTSASVILYDTLHCLAHQDGFFLYSSHWFHPDGIEFLLMLWAHGMSIVESPSKQDLGFFDGFPFHLTAPGVDFEEVRRLSSKWEAKGTVGKDAAICNRHMKGWQGRLRDVNHLWATVV